jgi:hypothetical protein
MARARRKSTAPIPLVKALTLAAKRLGVNDLDYAKKRLHQQLAKSSYGRDWFAQAIDPPDADISRLWARALTLIDWEKARGKDRGKNVDVYGITIAPAVIAALAPAVPQSRPGHPSEYDEALIAEKARTYIDKHGPPDHVEGDGGLLEKVTALVGRNFMPRRTRALEILGPILKQAKERRSAN